MRKFAAIFFAPLVPAILMILTPILISQSWPFNQTDYKLVAVISIFVSYFSVLLLGIPIMVLLQRAEKLSLLNSEITPSQQIRKQNRT